MTQDDSKIEQLKKKLYSNSDNLPPPHRGKLHSRTSMVNSSWETPPEEEYPTVGIDEAQKAASTIIPQSTSKFSPFPQQSKLENVQASSSGYQGFSKKSLKNVFIFAGIFFVVAIAIAAYIFLGGFNSISANNIDIKLLGPVSSPAGEELSLDVDITNKNNSDIILADLIMTYPPGTRQAGDKQSSMVSARIPIGTIKSGQTVRQTVKSILFGEENVRKSIKITIEYRVEGSDTVFLKEKEYPIFIGSSPITVTVSNVKEITADQEAVFTIKVVSNSSNVVKGMVLKADYPFGFKYTTSDLQPINGTNVWLLGDISPGDSRTIVMRGTIIGDDNEDRVFRFYAGTEDPQDKTAIGTIFVNTSATIAVRKPFIGADIALDGSGDLIYVANAGSAIKGEITWQNNLDIPINDVEIEATLGGDMLDKSSVDGDRGFYRSNTNTIIWNKSTLDDLKEIAPGEVGRVQFSFASLPPSLLNNSNFRRPSMSVNLSLRGKRLNEERVPEEITSTASRQIKIASGLTMQTKLVRSEGPFENTGAIPPEAEKPTTYTVIVSIANSFNTVRNTTYTATLPPYVQWINKISPENSAFTYSPDKRQITVNLGEIVPGTGYSSAEKQFAYQVTFLPSVSQIGMTPVIINPQRIAGSDIFGDVIVEDVQPPLDIKIDADPTYLYGQDKVVSGQ